MKFKKSLFIFRRDLRLTDNTALIQALKNSKKVIPCFIFDPRQIETNDYKSERLIDFMLESLQDLDKQIIQKKSRLYFFYGLAEEVVKKILEKENIDAVFLNMDYTPFSKNRDDQIKLICQKKHIEFNSYQDIMLNSPEEIKNISKKFYTTFNPYFKKAKEIKVKEPEQNKYNNYYRNKIELENKEIFLKLLNKIPKNKKTLIGGRKKALEILEKLNYYKNYKQEKDYPCLNKTTKLSAYLKFGCISIRETYNAIKEKLGKNHALIRQLYWRDFYTQIAFNFPHVFTGPFRKDYSNLKWKNDEKKLEKWKKGMTGFPIVDAGMRELNETGFINNRIRMIVASFLVKDLHIDWKIGEKYFAQKLIDYDPSINNGNWQWCASTGCNPQPYFRIFNPWLQQINFDKECVYIKKFIPELKNFTNKEIHNSKRNSNLGEYPKPMLIHSEEAKKAIKYFKK